MVTRIIAGDLATGKITQSAIPVRSASCEQQLNAAGTISAGLRLPLIDPLTGNRVPITDQVAPGKSFLAYVQDGVVLNAGPIWSDSYDTDSRAWSMSARGMLSVLDAIYIMPASLMNNIGQSDFSTASVTYSGMTYRTIAKRIVQEILGYRKTALPIDFEDDDLSQAFSRTYNAIDLKTAGSALQDLTALVNGVDVAMEPYLTADGNYVRWRLRTGNPELAATGAPWIWNTTGPAPSAIGVTVNRSAETKWTDAFEIGAQSTTQDATGADVTTTLTYRAGNDTPLDRGFPRMMFGESRSDVSVQSTLQGYAFAQLQSGGYYAETWGFKSRIAAEPQLRNLRAGDYGTLNVKDHPFIRDGGVGIRIMSISATLGESTASIATAPIRG